MRHINLPGHASWECPAVASGFVMARFVNSDGCCSRPPGDRLVTDPGRSGSIFIAPCPICPLMPPQIPRLRSPGCDSVPVQPYVPDSRQLRPRLLSGHCAVLEADTRGREIWEGADVPDDPTGLFQSVASSRGNRPEDDASPSGMILLPAPLKGAVGSSGGAASGLGQEDQSPGRQQESSERSGISITTAGSNASPGREDPPRPPRLPSTGDLARN